MELKRVQVHMLPTEDKHTSAVMVGVMPDIMRATQDEDVINDIHDWMRFGTPQHLYFTTDEEIKEGDKILWEGKIYDYREFMSMKTHVYTNYGKIIATTDPELIGDKGGMFKTLTQELPQPSQAFIKAYCEQGGFDEVDVEYEINPILDLEILDGKTRVKEIIFIPKVDLIHNTITTHRIKPMTPKEAVLAYREHAWTNGVSLKDCTEWIKENL